MNKLSRFLFLSFSLLASAVGAAPSYVKVDTNLGSFTLALDGDKAPVTVANFLRYVDEGFYRGTLFHRSVKNFVVQGGGYDGSATEKPTHAPIVNEAANGLRNQRGTVAMARTSDPNSATSQFYVNVVDNASLDFVSAQKPGYAVFGRVVDGMAVIDAINALPVIRYNQTLTELPLADSQNRVPVYMTKVARLKTTAHAGSGQSADEGTGPVVLDGTGSGAASGAIASYRWTQLGGPPVALSDPASPTPSFMAPAVGASETLTFQLVVTDADGTVSEPATVRVVVNDQNAPAGLWDLYGRTSMKVKTGGRRYQYIQNAGHAIVQFGGDRRYQVMQGLNVPGTWQFLRGSSKKYAAHADPAAINATSATPRALSELGRLFTESARKKLRRTPVIRQMRLRAFDDKGTLVGRTAEIRGQERIAAEIIYGDTAEGPDRVAEVSAIVVYRGLRASAPSGCCSANDAARNLRDSQTFLAENAKLRGVRTTASGLQYRIMATGRGTPPTADGTVTASYRAYLPSGAIVDGNSGVALRLADLAPGWSEGLQLMRPGAYYRLYLPPALAFGDKGLGSLIKPNSVLIFDIVLQ